MSMRDRALARLNRWFLRRAGGDARPVFYEDIGAVCPELLGLDRGFEEIRDEVLGVIDRGVRMQTYRKGDMETKPVRMPTEGGGEKGWGLMMLFMMGERPESHRRLFPTTTALVDRVPRLWQAKISVLAPGKSIPAHCGQYAGYLRYHLGLRVPRENPPRLRVRDQWYEWKEGESVLFDDAWDHEVVNESPEMRVVLMVDIRRPSGWFTDGVNRFVTHQIVRRAYAPKVLGGMVSVEVEPKGGGVGVGDASRESGVGAEADGA